MSRAGREARKARLIAAGLWNEDWTPSQILERQKAAEALKRDERRRSALVAEKASWIAQHGSISWEREVARRRAESIKRSRARRLAHIEGKKK